MTHSASGFIRWEDFTVLFVCLQNNRKRLSLVFNFLLNVYICKVSFSLSLSPSEPSSPIKPTFPYFCFLRMIFLLLSSKFLFKFECFKFAFLMVLQQEWLTLGSVWTAPTGHTLQTTWIFFRQCSPRDAVAMSIPSVVKRRNRSTIRRTLAVV